MQIRNYFASELENFDAIKNKVLNAETNTAVSVHSDKNIKRKGVVVRMRIDIHST